MVFSYRTTALNRCCVAILSGFLFTQRIAEAKTDGRHRNLVLDYKAKKKCKNIGRTSVSFNHS